VECRDYKHLARTGAKNRAYSALPFQASIKLLYFACIMQIRTNIQPGDLGYVISLHGILYAQEYGLDHTFEGYVASGVGEFGKSFDERKDRLWLAEDYGQIAGSIAIAGQSDLTAQLRWFLVAPDARGCGLGNSLLKAALDFCRAREFRSVFLWTLSDLKGAARLYQQAGFHRTEHETHEIWGAVRTEERYDLTLEIAPNPLTIETGNVVD